MKTAGVQALTTFYIKIRCFCGQNHLSEVFLMLDIKLFIDMAKKLVEPNLEKLLNKIVEKGEDKYNDFLIKTDRAFDNYYLTSIKKNLFKKTLISPKNPENLYATYVHMKLKNEKTQIKTEKITDLLDISKHILITGVAGCGKTTLLRHLFFSTITDQKQYIPLFFELRNFTRAHNSVIDFLYQSLREDNFKFDRRYFVRLLLTGKFVLLFDGYDEIPPTIRDNVGRELIGLLNRYHRNAIIINSRPSRQFISWHPFTEFDILPLSKPDATKLVKKLRFDEDLKEQFCVRLNDDLYCQHKTFLSNPLLLVIMLITFSERGGVPDKTHLYFSYAFNVLFNMHDASKYPGFKRKRYVDLAQDQFEKVLSGFCITTYLGNKINFSYEEIIGHLKDASKLSHYNYDTELFCKDMLESLCILIKDGLKYTYTHRSFQEYFSAKYIINTPEQAIRRKLIELIEPKIDIDQTCRLLFDMDQERFEKDYILPKLEHFNESIALKSEGSDELIENYIEQFIPEINIFRNGFLKINASPKLIPLIFIHHCYERGDAIPLYGHLPPKDTALLENLLGSGLKTSYFSKNDSDEQITIDMNMYERKHASDNDNDELYIYKWRDKSPDERKKMIIEKKKEAERYRKIYNDIYTCLFLIIKDWHLAFVLSIIDLIAVINERHSKINESVYSILLKTAKY